MPCSRLSWRAGRSFLARCVLLSLVALPLKLAAADALRVCVDQVDWAPYLRVRNGQAEGPHIDLMRNAIERAGLRAEFLPMPWVRCQLQAREGTVDAIAPLVFSQARNADYHYPQDAALGERRFAIEVIDDVVVSLASDGFDYAGNLQSLPQPVRVPRGWEIGPFLRQQGLEIDDGAPSDQANLFKLQRDRRGSVVATRRSADEAIAASPQLAELRISALPVRSLAYYLAFSRRSAIDAGQRLRIWQALAELQAIAGSE